MGAGQFDLKSSKNLNVCFFFLSSVIALLFQYVGLTDPF